MIEHYLREYEVAAADGGATAPGWFRSLQADAIELFRASGFPGPKDEEWRFTPIAPLVRATFRPAGSATPVGLTDLEPFLFGRLDWPRLVLVDGRFSPELSQLPSIAGLAIANLASVVKSGDGDLASDLAEASGRTVTPFASLNAALGMDGTVLRLASDSVMEEPVHLVHVTTPGSDGTVTHPRLLVVIGERARAQVIESYVGLGSEGCYWTNVVCDVRLSRGAWVEHTRIQRESESAYHTGVTEIRQEADSHYRSFSFAIGGAIARHDLRSRLGGSGAEALLYGLYFGRGDQLVDNHTTIFHDQPDCRSWEVYKGILTDRAHGVFNGKIIVQPIAQKTDAKQTNRALLLSDTAKIDTKPQLEIFADDVKCTHGATVGNLDPLARFYLTSRGIPDRVAGELLTYAFAAEVLNEISAEPVRTVLDRLIHGRLASDRLEAHDAR